MVKEIHYFGGASGATDVTAQVVAGTYTLDNMIPGESRKIRIKVKVKPTVALDTTKQFTVKATSNESSAVQDVVKFAVHVVP